MESLGQAEATASPSQSGDPVAEARLEEEFSKFFFESEVMDFVLEDDDGS